MSDFWFYQVLTTERDMNKIVMVVMAVFAVVLAGKIARAADAPAYKFGYVDFQRALNEVEEGKKVKSLLKTEFDEKQKKLDAVQEELQAMKTDLDKQRLILSQEALKEKEEIFRKKFMELQQKLASFKDELQMKEAKVTQDILVVIEDIVKNIGRKEGYTMILEKSQNVVLYSLSDSDMTERVIKEYNSLPKGKKDEIIKTSVSAISQNAR
jgi:outer membrane protein